MKTKSLTALLMAFFATVSLAFAEEVKNVSVSEAEKLIQEGKVTVVDVRTPEEFKEGHIAGAKNVNVMDKKSFEPQLAELDKDKPVLVHCQAGGRSSRSLPTLEKLGFTKVYHLNEGFAAWEKAGKPVEK